MKLTPKERLQVYQQALEFIRRGVYDDCGLCRLIANSIYYKVKPELSWDDIRISMYFNDMKHFPELHKRKPRASNNSVYWFKRGDMVPRVKILKAAVNELKKKGY